MDFSSDFPILKKYTYLNTAYSGLLPVDVAAWRAGHDKEFVEGGSNFREKNTGIINNLRTNISNLFSVKKENTFLVPNFSIGFNTLLNGLDKKHRFLLLKEDYPSIVYPVTSMGFEYREVAMNEKMEEYLLDAIENFKPTIFAFSMVQYISGLRMDDAFIKKIKEKYPDLLLVADGTQFTGTTVFNFSLSGLDALLGSGYKWLLGGYGNGYVFLSDQMKESLYQARKSKIISADPSGNKNYLSLCFEPGHLDSLNFGSLDQGLNYLQSLGMDYIEKTNQQLCQTARKAFHYMGLIPEWMFNRSEQSTIINLPLESKTIDKLNAAGILTSVRGNGLRISFHFYNTRDHLNQFLDVLDQK
ncbi:MAG TPA: aminotransferase class V-fold PLP-dependent enzyme [Hanamia sp.]|nr:aminotransferase class V-fold PLP-dependent enzyme [Hanamia sp.]